MPQSLIAPVAVISDNFTNELNFINGNGMVGASYQQLAIPGGSAEGMAYSSPVASAFMELDLGGEFDLESLFLWNGNQTGNTDRSAKSFDVRVSDDTDFSDSTVLTLSGFSQPVSGGFVESDVMSLASLGAELDGVRYIRLDNFTNFGDPDYIVLSEIRFGVQSTILPEPASLVVWTLIGLVGLGYGVLRRRKR